MLERDIEKKLKDQVKAAGGLCLKFVSPGFTGVPDRIILVSGGTIAFAELKAPGMKERPRQLYVQKQLRALGFTVFSAVDSTERILEIVAWVERVRATRLEARDEQI